MGGLFEVRFGCVERVGGAGSRRGGLFECVSDALERVGSPDGRGWDVRGGWMRGRVGGAGSSVGGRSGAFGCVGASGETGSRRGGLFEGVSLRWSEGGSRLETWWLFEGVSAALERGGSPVKTGWAFEMPPVFSAWSFQLRVFDRRDNRMHSNIGRWSRGRSMDRMDFEKSQSGSDSWRSGVVLVATAGGLSGTADAVVCARRALTRGVGRRLERACFTSGGRGEHAQERCGADALYMPRSRVRTRGV